jgi:hypothetical protein
MLEEREKKDKSFKYCFKQMVEERERREKIFYIKIMLREKSYLILGFHLIWI